MKPSYSITVAQARPSVTEIAAWFQRLQLQHQQLRPCFARAERWQHARRYQHPVLSVKANGLWRYSFFVGLIHYVLVRCVERGQGHTHADEQHSLGIAHESWGNMAEVGKHGRGGETWLRWGNMAEVGKHG